MKCPACRVQMSAQIDQTGLVGGHECPLCHRSVVTRDAGYSPTVAPEPVRSPFRPVAALAPAASKAEDEDDEAPDVCPPAILAALCAALDAQGVESNRYPPKRCGLEACGEWFIPLSGNARYCKTKTPLCGDLAETAVWRRARDARKRLNPFAGASFRGGKQ